MKISEKLKALQAQRQTAIDAADAILATVSDESLTPEQTAECDKHLAEVDRILKKIHEEGIDSLTPREKMFLQDASRRRGGRP